MSTSRASSVHTPAMSTLSGVGPVTCGRYELIAKIGHGGMADVFLGVAGGEGGFRKLIVVKRMHPELLEEEQFREMFLDEARLAARLNHINVVQTQEVDTSSDGVPYIAMEYLEGQSLDKIVRQSVKTKKPLTLEFIVPIMMGVLDALHYAHTATDFDGSELSVVHRDISPGNIFVTYEGAPKLLDFGIAKATTQVSETRTGNIKGKLSYMAPEQARSQKLDGRADIWSTGVVFWECVAKRRLFRDTSDIETIRRVLAGDVPPLDEHDADIPLELLDIIDKALTVDRDERWESAAVMRDALTTWTRKTNFEAANKIELAAYLKDLFGDQITNQKERIRLALEAFDARENESQERALVNLDTAASSTGTFNAPAPAPSASRNLIFVLGALLLVATGVIAGILANKSTGPDRPELTTEVSADPPPAIPPVVAAVPPVTEMVATTADSEALAVPDAGEAVVEAVPSMVTPMGMRRRFPMMTATTADMEPDVVVMAPTMMREEVVEATGRLSIVTTPWSNVYINGRRIGQTPMIGIELPAGRHVLDLRNPEENIQTRYPVTIGANGHERVRISLR